MNKMSTFCHKYRKLISTHMHENTTKQYLSAVRMSITAHRRAGTRMRAVSAATERSLSQTILS